MNVLAGESVLLAGATGKVGGATLTALLADDARVMVISRHEARARELIATAGSGSDRASVAVADLTDPRQAAGAVAACVKAYGRIDALVSLAGTGFGSIPLVESTVDDLRKYFAAFTETAYNLAVPALRAMLAQPIRDGARSRGRIVMVTAGSSKAPAPGRGLFGAAKAGVNVLMQAIAREHKADGIVANALVLGGVATEQAREYLDDAEFAAAAAPEEVARVLTFLASDASSGINGALVDLNAREVD
jgi:NAD(P)-dependent dehydrogenase (short-subunit alcohol dehydrogenase family)